MEQDAADRPSESFNTSTEDSLVTDTRAQGETVDAGLKEDHKDADGLNPSQPPTEATDKKPNGEAPTTAPKEPSLDAADPHEPEDTQMTDVQEPTTGVDQEPIAPTVAEAPSTNGTPVPNKRASVGGSSKKKHSAVPEHKSKKLNRKKSRPLTHLDAQSGEYYFARMKGHPPWPSIICDEEMLPNSLLSTRPVTARLPDGSFKRADYADGGKRSHERTFPVMFLHTNEFAWIPNTELTPLDPESDEIKTPAEKGKSKTLLAAYNKAAEANEMQAFKTMLREHELALQEDLAKQEEIAAKKADKDKRAAAGKGSGGDDEDEMDIDDDEVATKAKSKKRKKATDDNDEDEKPTKTPKTATKLKLSTPKQPSDSSPKKKSQKSKAKPARTTSDEDDEKTPLVEEKPPSPEALREMKEKKVLYYRHKLQRGFLSREKVPDAEEMGPMSDYLKELEEFKELEGSIIRATKIHKVLKQMIKLESIPLNEEYNFKERASKLLSKWNDVLSNEASTEDKPESKAEDHVEGKQESSKTAEPTTDIGKERTANADATTEPSTETGDNEGAKQKEPEADSAEAVEASLSGNDQRSPPSAQEVTEESKDTPVQSSTEAAEPQDISARQPNEKLPAPAPEVVDAAA